jgi:uncharacterized protein
MISSFRIPSLFVFLLAVAASFAFGQTAAELQERMRERLPQIDAMKREQLVGENNRGFLEARGPVSPEQQRVVREENEDRRKVYEALAAQTRANPEQVGRVRARQLAERSLRGVLIQNERGEWEAKR